jgi:predicted PurR-regulated permease PerM
VIPDGTQTASREEVRQADVGQPSGGFVRRTLITIGLATAAVSLVVLLVYAAKFFLLVFAGILVAIFLRGLSDRLSAHSFLSPGWALGVVVVIFLGLVGLLGWGMGSQIVSQVRKFEAELPEVKKKVEAYLEQYGLDEYVRNMSGKIWKQLSEPGLLTRGESALFVSLQALTDFIVILFLGFFFATEPQAYINGILHLFPQTRRPRIREVLFAVNSTLGWWLVGRFLVMGVVAVIAGVGLQLMGVPVPWMLATISAVLSFIPNIGLIFAAVIAALFGLASGPDTALYVLLLYLGIGTLEGWILTPLIQQRTLSMPAGLILAAQVLLGALLGGLGVFLATPLAAMVFVIVKRLYVQDALGDHSVQ